MYPEKTVLQMDRQMDRAEFIGTLAGLVSKKQLPKTNKHFLSN